MEFPAACFLVNMTSHFPTVTQEATWKERDSCEWNMLHIIPQIIQMDRCYYALYYGKTNLYLEHILFVIYDFQTDVRHPSYGRTAPRDAAAKKKQKKKKKKKIGKFPSHHKLMWLQTRNISTGTGSCRQETNL